MTVLRTWFRRAMGVFAGPRQDVELEDEPNSHIDAHIADKVRAGLTTLSAGALANTIQRAVASLDPSLPIIRLREMDEVFDDAIRREIGIRVSLGATRQAVLRMILRQGLGLTVSGVVIGLVIALAAGRLITSLLFGVTAADPLTLAGVVALIAGVALIACYVPGHAATRVDPIVALREE